MASRIALNSRSLPTFDSISGRGAATLRAQRRSTTVCNKLPCREPMEVELESGVCDQSREIAAQCHRVRGTIYPREGMSGWNIPARTIRHYLRSDVLQPKSQLCRLDSLVLRADRGFHTHCRCCRYHHLNQPRTACWVDPKTLPVVRVHEGEVDHG